MTASTPKSPDGGSTSKVVRKVWDTESWRAVYRTDAETGLRPRVYGLLYHDQLDFFEQAPDGVASVEDVPRAVRAHTGRVTPGER